MNKNTPKFKRSESFYIRDGWFEKAIHAIAENKPNNIFSKNKGVELLGIGSNMVKGLKYWLQASKIVHATQNKTELIELGELILKYDPYLADTFTWFLIHYNLCINYEDCFVFYKIFNTNFKCFKKDELVSFLTDEYLSDGYENPKKEYIDDDVSIFLKSYVAEGKIDNPENNYMCPLSSLKLIFKGREKYEKNKPSYSSLSYLLVYYALTKRYEKDDSFKIEDSFEDERSPFLIFNLDKNMYLQYIEEMKRNNLVTVNKTAGLNSVYFEKRLTLEGIFEMYFGGK